MQSHPFPEPDSPDLEPYLIRSPGETQSLLLRMADSECPVTVYAGTDGGFAVGALEARSAQREGFAIRLPPSELALLERAKARTWIHVLFFEGVKVQFRTPPGRLQDSKVASSPVLVDYPKEVLRLQRRETFRVKTPITSRPVCLIPLTDGDTKYESLRVMNISLGGLAVMSYPRDLHLVEGTVLRDCYLDLPGVGPINVAIRVVNLYESPNSRESRRFGCQFTELLPQARLMVQRYVNKVEAMQSKALRDPTE